MAADRDSRALGSVPAPCRPEQVRSAPRANCRPEVVGVLGWFPGNYVLGKRPRRCPGGLARRPQKQLYGMDQRQQFPGIGIATGHSCSIRPQSAHTTVISRRAASAQIPHSSAPQLTALSTPSRFPPLGIVQRLPVRPPRARTGLRIGVGVEQSLTDIAVLGTSLPVP